MVDLPSLIEFNVHPLELVIRGTAVYWLLFSIFRFVLRRDAGSLGIADILLLVLIADASQSAMAGPYESIAEGFVLVGTIVFWNWLLDRLSYRYGIVRRFAEPPPLVLVRRGRIIGRNLRREYITMPELMAGLRTQGVSKLAEVKIARMEADGTISVIRAEPPPGEDSGGGAGGVGRHGPADAG